MSVTLFFCYAREDEALLNQLKAHLRPLQRQELIDVWYDRDINAGMEWEQEISKHLNAAQILLLLVSPDFINSDYSYGTEMQQALERHERGEAKVIPIILRPVDWHNGPIGKLQALPTDAKPVTDPKWHSVDEALYDATKGIRVVVNDLRSKHILREAQKLYNDHHDAEALLLYEQATQLEPKSAKAYQGKGDALYNLKRYRESLDAYAKAQQANSSIIDINFYSRQAYAYIQLACYEESLLAYDAALLLNLTKVEKVNVYQSKANVLLILKRYDKTLACYDAALRLDTETPDLYANKADILLNMGKNEEARASYIKALRSQPDNAQFRLRIENSLARIEDKAGPSVKPDLRQLVAKLRRGSKPKRLLLVAISCSLFILLFPFVLSHLPSSGPKPIVTPTPAFLSAINLDNIRADKVGNEMIGISDGRFVLDNQTKADAQSYKEQAANYFSKGDYPSALAQWNTALEGDNSNDAEALIYQENLRVFTSGASYITFVVAVSFNSNDALSAPALRGAYVAQKECNDGIQPCGGMKIRLLIANSGSKPDRSKAIAEQIVEAAKFDKSIVGVLGGTTTRISLNMIPILTAAHIPMVGSNPSGGSLTGISPYFFRVMPTNKDQVSVLAAYIKKNLSSYRCAIFEDGGDSYSQDLAQELTQRFTTCGPNIQFTIGGDQATLAQKTRDLLDSRNPPDIIFFTSYKVDDMKTLLNTISTDTNTGPKLKVIMGSGYQLVEADGNFSGYNRVLYATGAFADMWDVLAPGKAKMPFFCEYVSAFDPQKRYPEPSYCVDPPTSDPQNLQKGSPYTYTRPTSYDMLNYDGMKTLFAGIQNILKKKQKLTSEHLKEGLADITGSQAIQGVTGVISLGSNGDSINKSIVILRVDNANRLQMSAYQGCPLIGEACTK